MQHPILIRGQIVPSTWWSISSPPPPHPGGPRCELEQWNASPGPQQRPAGESTSPSLGKKPVVHWKVQCRCWIMKETLAATTTSPARPAWGERGVSVVVWIFVACILTFVFCILWPPHVHNTFLFGGKASERSNYFPFIFSDIELNLAFVKL